jgi:hypothetical protein
MTKLPARSLCMLAMNAFVRDKLVLTAENESAAVCRSVHTWGCRYGPAGTNSQATLGFATCRVSRRRVIRRDS